MKNLAIGRPGDSTATLRPWRGPSQVESALCRESARHGDHEESMIGESLPLKLQAMRGSLSITTMWPRWHCGHSRNGQPVSSSYRSR